MSGAHADEVKRRLSEAARMGEQNRAMSKRILESALKRLDVVNEELNGEKTEKYESLLEEKGTLEQVIATAQSTR